jgi:hypothetical protein
VPCPRLCVGMVGLAPFTTPQTPTAIPGPGVRGQRVARRNLPPRTKANLQA